MHARVVLVDRGCNLDPSVMWSVAEAATIQAHRDFGRPVPYGYGVTATVRVAADPDDIRDDEWVLEYLPDTPPGGLLGFHDRTPAGQPRMVVFPFLEDPRMRGVVETHEILETLANPLLDHAIPDASGRLIACEPADPVEPSWYSIAVRGRWIPVTNFVMPAYYLPQYYPIGRYDFLGLLRYPGEVLPGGYKSVLPPGGGWVQEINGAPRAYRSVARRFGRSHRRAAARTSPLPIAPGL